MIYAVMAMFAIPVIQSYVLTDSLPLPLKVFMIGSIILAYIIAAILISKVIYRKKGN